jgi:hypothetical protein
MYGACALAHRHIKWKPTMLWELGNLSTCSPNPDHTDPLSATTIAEMEALHPSPSPESGSGESGFTRGCLAEFVPPECFVDEYGAPRPPPNPPPPPAGPPPLLPPSAPPNSIPVTATVTISLQDLSNVPVSGSDTFVIEVLEWAEQRAEALANAVGMRPVSAAIDAHHRPFKLYRSGVFSLASCTTHLTHGLLVVGYGAQDGRKYWKVKNSWGTTWGQNGFGKVVRDQNMCAIGNWANYPIIPNDHVSTVRSLSELGDMP